MAKELISIVLPVYNEAENIVPCLTGLWDALQKTSHEILVCYDREEDTTLSAIKGMKHRPPSVRLVRNDIGPGVANALRAGFREAKGDVVVTTMADLSDEPQAIPLMAEKVRAGAAVVSGSRYMKGGRQTGGPLIKRFLSRLAGSCLYYMAGLGTHDATTNFRAYSAEYLHKTEVESRRGFEVALELTVKAQHAGLRVDEVPTTWRDRSAGESRFRLWKWMPCYLRWFSEGIAPALFVWATLIVMLLVGTHNIRKYSLPIPQSDEWDLVPQVTGASPIDAAWLWARQGDHRVLIPKAIYGSVNRLMGYDSTAINTIDLCLLGAASLLLVLAVRRLRGRLSYTDAFFPLLFLNWGQWETLNMSWGVTFAVPSFLTAVAVCLIARSPKMSPRRLAAWMGPCLVLLSMGGTLGLVVVLLLAPWLAWAGIRAWRRREDPDRLAGALAVGFAAAAYCLLSICVLDFPPHPGYKAGLMAERVGDALGVAGQALCASMGEGAGALWPLPLYPVIGILLLAGLLLLWVSIRSRPERMRSLGLLLLFLGYIAVAVVIGFARAKDGGYASGAGLASRYSALTCGVLAVVYLAFQLYAWRPLGRLVRVLLAIAMWAFLWHNMDSGVWLMERRLAVMENLQKDIRHNVPIPELARRYAPVFFTAHEPNVNVPLMEARLGMLAAARMGIFRELPPPDGRWGNMAKLAQNLQPPPGRLVDLPDGRLGLVTFTPSRTYLPLSPGTREATVAFVIPAEAFVQSNRAARVQFRILLGHDGGPDDQVLTQRLDPMANLVDRQEIVVRIDLTQGRSPATRLILETLDPTSSGSPMVSLWTRADTAPEGQANRSADPAEH